jgi:lincosamide nucleotidyltransferase A/C/D/E
MGFRDVLEVALALREEGLKFWFAGGWGVDVLVGLQSRDHLDLDIVIEDYRRDELRLCRALSKLGYLRAEVKVGGIWMPSVVALSDWSGRRIEFMEIDWERFAVDSGLVASDETGIAVNALRESAFAEGVIFDHKLPCLSRRAQLLFHSNFTLTEKHRRDLDVLKES